LTNILNNAIMLSMEKTPFTSHPINNEDWAANNAARLRANLDLPVDATQEQVNSTMAAKEAARLRANLGDTAIRQ
jgi:hypothetical protein